MLWLALACSPAPAPDASTVEPGPAPSQGVKKPVPSGSPSPSTAPHPAVDAGFVQASSLNVRAAPEASADLRARLPVNTKVAVLERKAEWMRVTGPNGESGWVAAQFVSDQPLSVEAAKAGAAAATTEVDRLAWWQRAAALAPADIEVLTALEAAYRAVGETDRAAWVAKVRSGEGTPWERWFSPDQRTEADAITVALKAVSTPEELAVLHARALASASSLSDSLNQNWDVQGWMGDTPDPTEAFTTRLPWTSIGYYAEGTSAQFELDSRAWAEAAERTPGRQDDTWIKLMVDAYGNAGANGWPTWFERTWDYGGCSLLGTGIHLRLLQTSDGFREPPFAARAQAVRAGVLADIVDGSAEFPWCDPVKGPTDPARLRTEVEGIRDRVDLTPDERVGIEARLTKGFADE